MLPLNVQCLTQEKDLCRLLCGLGCVGRTGGTGSSGTTGVTTAMSVDSSSPCFPTSHGLHCSGWRQNTLWSWDVHMQCTSRCVLHPYYNVIQPPRLLGCSSYFQTQNIYVALQAVREVPASRDLPVCPFALPFCTFPFHVAKRTCVPCMTPVL